MDYKFVIVGDSQVGKSALVSRLAHDVFQESYIQTIGRNNIAHNNVLLIDIGGKELNKLNDKIYKDVNASFLMIDNRQNLNVAKLWKEKLNMPIVLLVNKSDLLPDDELINYDSFCIENNIHHWVGISVKDNKNINLLLEDMIQLCHKNVPSLRDELHTNTTNIINKRKKYIKSQYPHLQACVLEMLKDYSIQKPNYECDINISYLYNHQLTKLFLGICPSTPVYPTEEELKWFTHCVGKYLTSQKLNVIYITDTHLKVNWQ